MTLVCNAGPVIALAKIDCLPLLRKIAQSVLIPETVFHEVLAKPGKESMRIMDAARNFLIVQPPPASVHPAVKHATRYLDAGESEVIALASSIPAPVSVVIDDAAGRRVAARLSITLLGFVGVLIISKRLQHIDLVLPLMEQARDLGYWLSDEVFETARVLANEEKLNTL